MDRGAPHLRRAWAPRSAVRVASRPAQRVPGAPGQRLGPAQVAAGPTRLAGRRRRPEAPSRPLARRPRCSGAPPPPPRGRAGCRRCSRSPRRSPPGRRGSRRRARPPPRRWPPPPPPGSAHGSRWCRPRWLPSSWSRGGAWPGPVSGGVPIPRPGAPGLALTGRHRTGPSGVGGLVAGAPLDGAPQAGVLLRRHRGPGEEGVDGSPQVLPGDRGSRCPGGWRPVAPGTPGAGRRRTGRSRECRRRCRPWPSPGTRRTGRGSCSRGRGRLRP